MVAVAAAGPAFEAVRAPNPGADSAYVGRLLSEVSARTRRDVWVVGLHGRGGGNTYMVPLLSHWDGRDWTSPTMPRPADHTGALISVTDLAPHDVWAFGTQGTDKHPWVLHRGRSGWTALPRRGLRRPFAIRGGLGLSPTSAWIVGQRPLATPPTAAHWNGARWTMTSAPLPPQAISGAFYGITRVPGTSQVITVGEYVASGRPHVPYAARWDGTAWQQMPLATPSGRAFAVTALSGSDAWLVGQQAGGRALVEHWDGVAWMEVGTPDTGSSVTLADVAAATSTDVVAVGFARTCTPAGGCSRRTLTERYDGSGWSVIPSANPSKVGRNLLFGTSNVPGTGVFWAVGEQGRPRHVEGADLTLVEKCAC
jgi:hypothetical protein